MKIRGKDNRKRGCEGLFIISDDRVNVVSDRIFFVWGNGGDGKYLYTREWVIRAADDLTLKNEFEREPKTGNDCPHYAEVRNL